MISRPYALNPEPQSKAEFFMQHCSQVLHDHINSSSTCVIFSTNFSGFRRKAVFLNFRTYVGDAVKKIKKSFQLMYIKLFFKEKSKKPKKSNFHYTDLLKIFKKNILRKLSLSSLI